MIVPDVNVLVYAHRADAADHTRYRDWLQGVVDSNQTFGLSDLVLSGVLRILTHPRVFSPPTPLETALKFIEELRSSPGAVSLAPGPRHWGIFTRLCRSAKTSGNLVPDAFLAALAMEHGAEWITTDRDFARFPGLRWRHPLD
ncbi:MAG: type II toxin-antitoxin system VapC family toxin [Planctomycetes bacterium]|nr:type II toxin-antitoxin system VapC family toxin [Planctomycetota bacterium]